MLRRLCPLALLLALATPMPAGAEGRLFASWHAAYGDPRASDTLTAACDNKGADTLYLSFDPGQDIKTFYAITATVTFHAEEGDTLGELWRFGGGSGNLYNVRVQAGPDPSFRTLQPWIKEAIGGVNYHRTASHGYLRMVYANSSNEPDSLKNGKRYCFARVMIPHPPASIAKCSQPICVELESANLTVQLIGGKELELRRGERFVSWNSPGGRVCGPMRERKRTGPWVPWEEKH